MDDYTSATYGDKGADLYDGIYPSQPSTAQIDLLEELGQGGRVLELGIGTGRLAIPLIARGMSIEGLDSSEAMVSKIHAKDLGSSIPVTIGDFKQFDLDKSFDLIFVAFNTLFSLLTQDAQISCFESVTRHLSQRGLFLVEAFVPDLSRFDRAQRTSVSHIEINRTVIDVAMHYQATQRIDSQHVVVEDGQPARICRSHFATPGRPNSTSWLGWQAYGYATDGGIGIDHLSETTPANTSRYGADRLDP